MLTVEIAEPNLEDFVKSPERQFWTYIALLSGVFLLGLSGQLISCAKAETVAGPTSKQATRIHPTAQADAPWNQPGPTVTSQPRVRLQAQLDRDSVLQNSSGIVRVEVRVDTQTQEADAPRGASDIVVVIDTSGSMQGQKLLFAKQALFELYERLTDHDRFALVQYSDDAQVLISLQQATPQAKARFREITESLVASGSTNIGAGLDRGAELLNYGTTNGPSRGRIVLLSDGLVNVGDMYEGLLVRANSLSKQGFALSTMGIGHDFDERLMTSLATSGTGAFYYLAKLEYLPEFLEAELASGRETYGYAAELQFNAAPGVQLIDAMGLFVEATGGTQVVRVGSLYTGRNRTLWLTLRVPTYRLGSMNLGQLSLAFQREGYRHEVTVGELPPIVCLNDRSEFERHVKRDVWERALLNNVFTQAEEDFGDAIRTGDRRIIEKALSSAEDERQLAERLGSTKVLSKIDELKGSAASAERAQAAPAPVRNEAAKKAKARGYQQRNSGNYKSLDSALQAY